MEHITYYQPYLFSTDGTNIDYPLPDELASFMVFRTIEDCDAWMEDNGYAKSEYIVKEYHDDDIEDPTFIDADGYFEDGTNSVSCYNTEKDLNEGFSKLKDIVEEAITAVGNPVKLKTPVTLYEDDATLGGTDYHYRPTIVSLDRYSAYDDEGRHYPFQNITDYDDYMMLVDAVALTM